VLRRVDRPARRAELARDRARRFAHVVLQRRRGRPFGRLQHDCDRADRGAGRVEDRRREARLSEHGFVVFGRDGGPRDFVEVLGELTRVDDGLAGHAAQRRRSFVRGGEGQQRFAERARMRGDHEAHF
jgi:hypothetical protein